jgi:alkanesulfonate monooxygenase SsuD/methylene tetrahydromethanopterin reductase-like flavin-dependent oxidoreductase (luciferase family)
LTGVVTVREFRFGVCVRNLEPPAVLRNTVARYEGLGYDVISIPDHLGAVAPFPMLTAIAGASTTSNTSAPT